MDTDEKIMCGFGVIFALAVLMLIGSCTYTQRKEANERFQLEQQRLEMTAQGKPTKLEGVILKLDDDQFKQLIEAIKEDK